MKKGAWLFLKAVSCFCLVAATLPTLASAAAKDAPQPLPTAARKLELIRLLKAEKFEALEGRIAEIFAKIDAGGSGKQTEIDVVYAFDRADPEIAGQLARWRDAYPNSFAPHLAFGLYSAEIGWAMRGEKTVDRTNPKRFEAMRGYFEAAVDSLRKAVTLRPKDEIAWAALIGMANVMGNRAHVASLFDEAMQQVPDSSLVYGKYFIALAPKWGGSIKKQRELKRRIRQSFPGNPDFAWIEDVDEIEQGWRFYRRREYEAAAKHFEKLVAKRESAESRWGRAMSLCAIGRCAEAVPEMQRALSLNPGSAQYYIELASLQAHQKEMWDAAARNFDIGISLDPYDTRALMLRAEFLADHGKQEAARKDLDRALFFGAYDDGVREFRRTYFLQIGDVESALEEAEKMVTLVPDNPFNHYAYGVTLYKNRDCTAREVLEHYLLLCRWPAECRDEAKREAEMLLSSMRQLCS